MAAFKTDGTFTTATIQGAARISFPIEGDITAKLIEQDFMIAFSSFAALALGTAHPTIGSTYLVSESPLQDMGGGIALWTRNYATVPAARDEFETFNYKFPGLLSDSGTNPPYNQYWVASDDGRDPTTKTVISRLRHDYTYTTTPAASITILTAQVFTLDSNTNAVIDYLLPAGDYWSDSNPTKEEWVALVAGGSGIGSGAAAGEFIAEDSSIERYMGNIWVRKTRYVKAQ